VDADFGNKTCLQEREDGSLWEQLRRRGYKLHLVVDADYELPVAHEVTRASRPDNESAKRMPERLEEGHPSGQPDREARPHPATQMPPPVICVDTGQRMGV